MSTPFVYKRKLPHWQPREGTFFVTYRLAGSIPTPVITGLKEKHLRKRCDPSNQAPGRTEQLSDEYFFAFENELHKNINQPYWLKDDTVASIVMDSLQFNNNKQYELYSASIMSNHVHILLRLLAGSPTLDKILQNHKKFTAVKSNKVLKRSGPFWEEESFDTLIRNNSHFYNVVNYIIQNPVKAGMVKNWYEWKWTYLHPALDKEYRMKVQ